MCNEKVIQALTTPKRLTLKICYENIMDITLFASLPTQRERERERERLTTSKLQSSKFVCLFLIYLILKNTTN